MRTLQSLLLAACLSSLSARADLLIYDLSFDTSGPSVNYDFLQGGFLVIDKAANSISSVVVLTDPTTYLAYSTTGLLTGSYMEITQDGTGAKFGVAYSTSGSGGDADNLAFQILGRTTRMRGLGGDKALEAAGRLRGYFFASAADLLTSNSTSSNSTSSNSTSSNSTSSNSTSSNSTTSNSTSSNSTSSNSTTSTSETFSFGFAGASKMTATLQVDLTSSANKAGQSSSEALDTLTQILVNRGILEESSLSTSSSSTNATTTTSQ